jgi:hypothetical protein
MRKFSGPMGSVSRVTVESEALKSNMLGDPSERVVDVSVPAGVTERDCPCLWTLSASRAAACRVRTTCATRASRRRPRCRAGHDSVRNRGGKARDTDERFHANPICRRNSRGARPACHQHGHRNGRQKNREGLQSEAGRNNDMGRQSTRGCSRNDAHLCLNTQVLALLTAKNGTPTEIIESASLTSHGSEGREVKHSSGLGGSVGRRKEVGCG